MLELFYIQKGKRIKNYFLDFHHYFPYMEIDELIEHFACFGGLEKVIELDCLNSLEESIGRIYFDQMSETERSIKPGYLVQYPYSDILTAVARGDGKMFNIFRRAGMNDMLGGKILHELEAMNVLNIEESREEIIKEKGKKHKKELRGYRIQPKVRFEIPFMRFWFGFVEPYREMIIKKEKKSFIEYYKSHKERVFYLIFEQLSTDLLIYLFSKKDPVVEYGSMWDIRNEFDILCHTRSGKIILGECKYSSRKICRNELGKLYEKAAASKIDADYYALFSKSGFSRELMSEKSKKILLFDINDFKTLLE